MCEHIASQAAEARGGARMRGVALRGTLDVAGHGVGLSDQEEEVERDVAATPVAVCGEVSMRLRGLRAGGSGRGTHGNQQTRMPIQVRAKQASIHPR